MICILYEDQDVLAVDKPEGLAVIPERDGTKPCLVTILAQQMGYRPWVVHRLDKAVSGVILFAKNPQAHRYLNGLFEQRKVTKSYLALVHGLVPQDAGTIDRPIRNYGSGRAGVDQVAGKPAVTKYQVLKRYGQFTLLQAEPVTGRRHQIRVHLFSIGHQIVGDQLYGKKDKNYPRLMLHSHRIGLVLPDGRQQSIQAPLPSSFQQILAAAQANSPS
ncbi:MAG: RluA family pseudouridine synthase [Sedimentisphaerales bacterium]|nr:RluA family pseudouridine synthase [Sedimentisphaerales bacterium]